MRPSSFFFIYTVKCFKYFYLILIIQFNFNDLFAQFYLTHRWNLHMYYQSGPGSNDNEGVFHIRGASPSDAV